MNKEKKSIGTTLKRIVSMTPGVLNESHSSHPIRKRDG